MVVIINLPAALIDKLGFDPAAIKGALLVMIFIGLLVYRALALVMLTAVVALGANLPAELAELWGINRGILIFILVVMIIIPLYLRWKRDTSLW
ncbi:hypothetical protein [Solemya pervernicosa gill symbiont]|nr:hypothetical protein [Solemya pervernicosa gill symbiont]